MLASVVQAMNHHHTHQALVVLSVVLVVASMLLVQLSMPLIPTKMVSSVQENLATSFKVVVHKEIDPSSASSPISSLYLS